MHASATLIDTQGGPTYGREQSANREI